MATQYKDTGLTLYKSGEFTDLCREDIVSTLILNWNISN